jgi:hypothetical protein
MQDMRAYALVLWLSLPLLSFTTGCSSDGEYKVVVSWLINGTAPSPAMCQEQGIARARFEVWSRGKKLQTLETDCASLVERWQEGEGGRGGSYVQYGGMITKRSFDWDESYHYALTLVDASGVPVSLPGEGDFEVYYGDADYYELPYLDYFHAEGNAATVRGEWSAGAGDVAADCATRRIANVSLIVSSALDADFIDVLELGRVPCAAGVLDSTVKLATGYYQFRYEAFSEGGAFISASEPIVVNVDGSQPAVILPRKPL